MANETIAQLTAGAPALTTDLIPVQRSSTNVSLKVSDILSVASNPPSLNNIVYLDGNTYPLTTAGLIAAIAAATNSGTEPGQVIIPPTVSGTPISITSTITVPSNCTIQGAGRNQTLFLAGASLNAVMFELSSASNVKLQGFSIDGNAANNANAFYLLYILTSTNVLCRDLRVGDGAAFAVFLSGANSYVSIEDSEIYGTGTTGGGSTGGLFLAGSHLRIRDCHIHDNILGVWAFNPTSSSVNYEDWIITGCSIHSNFSSGISFYAQYATGGTILGPRIENNDCYANGWPANGTGFPLAYSAGKFQTGSSTSSSGVGIELISDGLSAILQPVVTGNRCHDNIYDGITLVAGYTLTVNTNGTAVTATAGTFNVNWKAGTCILINSTTYFVASVTDTTHLTLTATAGVHNGYTMLAPVPMFGTVANNQSYNNGNAATGGTGCFNELTEHNTYSGNIWNHNNLAGLSIAYSTDIAVSGDIAVSNNQGASGSSAYSDGFVANCCLNTSFIGVKTWDITTSPTQTIGVCIASGCTNTTVISNGILATTPISDSGTSSFIIARGSAAASTGLTYQSGGNVILYGDATAQALYFEPNPGTVLAFMNASGLQSNGTLGAVGAIALVGNQATAGALGVAGVVYSNVATGKTAAVASATVFTTSAAGTYRVSGQVWPTTLSSAAWVVVPTMTCTQNGGTGANTYYVGNEVSIGTSYGNTANVSSEIVYLASGATIGIGVQTISGSNTAGVYSYAITIERLA